MANPGSASYMRPVQFSRTYIFVCGGLHVLFGCMSQSEIDSPVAYAAAFSEQDLHLGRCGWGATEAEALADLMRNRKNFAV